MVEVNLGAAGIGKGYSPGPGGLHWLPTVLRLASSAAGNTCDQGGLLAFPALQFVGRAHLGSSPDPARVASLKGLAAPLLMV